MLLRLTVLWAIGGVACHGTISSPANGSAEKEVCDGADNDADGKLDEATGGAACVLPDGGDGMEQCINGTLQCIAYCLAGEIENFCVCGDDDVVSSGFCCDGGVQAGSVAQDTDCGIQFATLRLNGGLEAGTSVYDGKDFFPLTDYLTAGQATNSDAGLQGNYPIYGTDFPGLYQVETWLPNNGTGATFTFPVENGDYAVHLHFVDWAMQFIGARMFHVDLQGRRVIEDLDIIAAVGNNTALIESFDVSVTDGHLTLTLTNVVGYPEIAAVEIVSPGQPFLGQIEVTQPPVAPPDLVPQPPVAPTDLTAAALSASSVELRWTDNADNEASYEVEWRLGSDAAFGALSVLACDSQTRVVTGLESNTEYVFRVAARNTLGHSGHSNEAHATTLTLPSIECSSAAIRCVDDNATEHQEYASIQAAVDAAGAGDTVYVRAGQYREEVTVAKDNLTVRAFPGEEGQAVISGAVAVSGWTLANISELDGNPNATQIYVADAPCDVQRLFQDGQELRASRYPHHTQSGENRYRHVSWVDSSNPNRIFSSTELNGVKPDGYFNAARAHVRTTQWTIGAARVSSFTASGGVTMQNAWTHYGASPGYGFYFTQVIGDIMEHGEWAWRNDRLYLMFDGVPSGVEAACRNHGIWVNANVENVTIHGLAIRRTRHDCVRVEALANQGITISNNTIEGCGDQGIWVGSGGGKMNILDNEIADCWRGGMSLRNTSAPHVQGNYVHEICAELYNDDTLTDGGMYQCAGIVVIDGTDAVITENRLDKIGYAGILVVNFGFPSNREVSFNYVSEAMLGLNDGGGIYFHNNNASPLRDKVHDNFVENCTGSYLGTTAATGYFPQGIGIYIDGGTETGRVDVERNTMAFNATNMYLHDTKENNIVDNVFYAGDSGHTHANLSAKHYCGYDRYNNVVDGNTFFSSDTSTVALRVRTFGAGCSPLAASDHNVFQGAGGSDVVIDTRVSTDTYYNLSEWQSASGMDGSSTESPTCSSANLLTNPSLQNVTCTGLAGCIDAFGVGVGSSLTIEPFGSQILCDCDNEPTCIP